MRSEFASCRRSTRSPFTYTPWRLLRSSMKYAPFSATMRACTRDARLSRRTNWLSPWRPIMNGRASIDTRARLPEGFTTTSAGRDSPACVSTSPGMRAARCCGRSFCNMRALGCFRHLALAKDLAMGAIAADLGSREHDLETELRLDLLPHAVQRFPEILFDAPAAQADDVRVFLLEARFVVVLVALVVHQVQLVHESADLEELERAVDGDAVQLRIFLFGELIELLGVEVLAGFVDQIEEDLALSRQPHSAKAQRIFCIFNRHDESPGRGTYTRGYHGLNVRRCWFLVRRCGPSILACGPPFDFCRPLAYARDSVSEAEYRLLTRAVPQVQPVAIKSDVACIGRHEVHAGFMPYARPQRLEPAPPLARLPASAARALRASAATARSGASDRRRTPSRPRCGFQAPGSAIFVRLAETLPELAVEVHPQLESTAWCRATRSAKLRRVRWRWRDGRGCSKQPASPRLQPHTPRRNCRDLT